MNKKVKMMIMVLSLVSVSVLMKMVLSPNRVYGVYEGHFYDMNLWWQMLAIMLVVTCAVSYFTRRSRYAYLISLSLAVILTTVFCVVVCRWSGWGVVRLLDQIGGGNANGVFLVWMVPVVAMMMAATCFALSRFIGSVGNRH